MISKELLSEVLHTVKEVIEVEVVGKAVCWKGYSVEGNACEGAINIYELAYKCKEWARIYNGTMYIISGCMWQNKSTDHVYYAYINKEYVDEYRTGQRYSKALFKTTADTEHEAIFKACEWIRTNR